MNGCADRSEPWDLREDSCELRRLEVDLAHRETELRGDFAGLRERGGSRAGFLSGICGAEWRRRVDRCPSFDAGTLAARRGSDFAAGRAGVAPASHWRGCQKVTSGDDRTRRCPPHAEVHSTVADRGRLARG